MLESEAKWDQHQVLTMIGYNPPKSTLNVRQKNLVKYTNSRWILGCMSMVFFIIWCLITKSHQKKNIKKKFGSKLSLKLIRASQIRKKNFTAILFFYSGSVAGSLDPCFPRSRYNTSKWGHWPPNQTTNLFPGSYAERTRNLSTTLLVFLWLLRRGHINLLYSANLREPNYHT